jgi:glycosyltransferase involved in cell wall biosynthesis
MTLVSVVIPTYNRAEFVLDAIGSVLAQGYTDYEIIVVDDGSSDNTKNALFPFIQQGTIRYYYQRNQGEAAARNLGIAMSQGDYIAFLDSDDLYEPEKLELQVAYLLEHPEIGLVHSCFVKFDDKGRDLGYRNTAWFSGWIYPQILLYWTTLMAIDTVIVPRRVFNEVGLFDVGLKMGPDLDMWRRIARRYPFGFIDRSLARVRVHSGNISGDKTGAADGFVKYLERAFEDDPALSQTFKRRALSRMYSTTAYNLLGEHGREAMRIARLNAARAVANNPFNVHGYIAFLSASLGWNTRRMLVLRWRSLRGWLMSRNRQG